MKNPKHKLILVQEELIQNLEYQKFLISSRMRISIAVSSPLTFDLHNELHAKYKEHNNLGQFYYNNKFPDTMDIYLFAPQNYEVARSYAKSHKDAIVVVIPTLQFDIDTETEGNFYVRSWVWVVEYVRQLYPKKSKKNATQDSY